MRRSVYSIASLLVCLELKPNSYDYRTRLPSISKLQHYRLDGSEAGKWRNRRNAKHTFATSRSIRIGYGEGLRLGCSFVVLTMPNHPAYANCALA